MSRVPSSLQRRREPETSPPRCEDALRPARSCRLGEQGPGLRSLGHRPPPGPCVCAGRAAALLKRGEARRGRPGTALPPRRRRANERASKRRRQLLRRLGTRRLQLRPACRPASTGLGTDPGHHPDDERGSAPGQVMDPRGNSRGDPRCSQDPAPARRGPERGLWPRSAASPSSLARVPGLRAWTAPARPRWTAMAAAETPPAR